MEEADLVTGTALKLKIDKIIAIKAKIAAAGNKGVLVITDADSNQIVKQEECREVLGDAAYDTVAANAKTALNTALTAAQTTAQTAFDALGEA